MILAELEIWHSRPIAPTRRVAIGEHDLPCDPPPGYGGILLAGIVASCITGLDPDNHPDLLRLAVTAQQDLDAEQFNATGGHILATGAETVTITWPDTETVAGTMFVTSINWTSQINSRMTANVTLKVSGALTFST